VGASFKVRARGRKKINRRATAKELFKVFNDFMKEKSIRWLDCVGVCMDAAHVMTGNKGKSAGLN
jgi:hypothetical protein